jgi:Pectate lyase superfamily protein
MAKNYIFAENTYFLGTLLIVSFVFLNSSGGDSASGSGSTAGAVSSGGSTGSARAAGEAASGGPIAGNPTGSPSTDNSTGRQIGTPTGTGTASAFGIGTSPVPKTAHCSQTSFTPPKLVSAVSPKDYGAAGNGTIDDTAAFQKALNAGDVMVPKGTYLINGTVKITSSNRHLQCEPGTVLKHTVREDSNMFNYEGPSTGDSIVNCTFVGANPTRVRDWDAVGHYDIPVQTNGAVDQFVLEGNTFSDFFGQSFFQTEGDNGGTGDVLAFNTFNNCPLYGVALVGSTNGYIAYNLANNCRMGPENNNPGENTGGNILECNHMVNGGNITGGSNGDGVDYSRNIVRYNVLDGGYIQVSAPLGGKPAQYIDNRCNGCSTE